MRYISVDLENAQSHDHVCEIGAVEVVGGRLTGRTFLRRVKPLSDMNPFCFAVHNISLEDLRHERTFVEILPEFLDFVGDAKLIAHNASCEYNTLRKEFTRAGVAPWERDRYTCTLAMTKRQRMPGKLRVACEHIGIPVAHLAQAHDALSDAELAARLFIHLSR